MAKVNTITVGIETSIKLAEYQYIKPRIDITYKLDNDEKPGEVMKTARERLTIEMQKLEKHVRKENKVTNDKDMPF